MYITGTMYLMSLARETLEEIASNLDSHRDLISLALVSSAWKTIIIPRHSQYRVIRIREDMPRLWAHLAQRADLARTIKAIHLYDDLDLSSPQIYPTTLVEMTTEEEQPTRSRDKEEDRKIKNMCQALSHMTTLKEFAWALSSSTLPTSRPGQEEAIFRALSRCKSLAHLALWGRFAERAHRDRDSNGAVFPLWNISNLETLTVNGGAWVNRMNAQHISAMLRRSPELQSLTFPMEFSALPDCRFPRLRKLALVLQSGATSRIDSSRVRFIEAHPSIEELQWYPIGDVRFTPGSLPNITHLSTRADLAMSILLDQGTSPRPLKHLCGLLVNSKSVAQLEGIVVDTLHSLRLGRYDDLQSIARLADVFPALTILETPPYATLADGFNIQCYLPEDWIPVLSRFQNLEKLPGGALWTSEGAMMSDNRLDCLIVKLAQACPKLSEIEHWQIDENRDCCKWIVIRREGSNIRWSVQSPPTCFGFDSIMEEFD